MRSLGAALLASSLIFTSAFAATAIGGNAGSSAAPLVSGTAPLAPGKPAGVKQAELHVAHVWLWVAGIGVAGLGLGLVAAGNGNNAVAPSTGTAQ